MNIRIWSGILPYMDISALNTTNDIEKLRAMALAMVQKVMSENAEKERELLEKSWLVCNAPCSKRMLMPISPRLPLSASESAYQTQH